MTAISAPRVRTGATPLERVLLGAASALDAFVAHAEEEEGQQLPALSNRLSPQDNDVRLWYFPYSAASDISSTSESCACVPQGTYSSPYPPASAQIREQRCCTDGCVNARQGTLPVHAFAVSFADYASYLRSSSQ